MHTRFHHANTRTRRHQALLSPQRHPATTISCHSLQHSVHTNNKHYYSTLPTRQQTRTLASTNANATNTRTASTGDMSAEQAPQQHHQAACLVLLPGTLSKAQLLPLLQEAHSQHCNRVYVHMSGAEVDSALLHWLAAELYAAVGQLDARWDVVPCLQCAGWTADRLVQSMSDVQLLVAPSQLQQQAQDLLQHLNNHNNSGDHGDGGGRQQDSSSNNVGGGVQLVLVQLQETQQQQQAQQQQQQQQQDQQQLQFANVAVGGTFDRLHAGHRLLLAATALVATHNVYIGVTADSLLAKKANKHLLQDFDLRRAAAVDFMGLVRPGLAIAGGALCDPQEPTQAELDPSMHALVVSAETLSGGQAINEGRKGRGFEPVELVVVGLVGGSGDAASKLSSTALRQADAAAAGAGGGGGAVQ